MTIEELLKPRYKVIADYPHSPFEVGDILIHKDICLSEDEFVYYDEEGICRITPKYYPAIFRKLGWWEERDEKDMPEYVRYKGCEMFRLNSPKMGEVLKVDNYQEDCLNHNKGCDWISLYEPATEQEYLNQ